MVQNLYFFSFYFSLHINYKAVGVEMTSKVNRYRFVTKFGKEKRKEGGREGIDKTRESLIKMKNAVCLLTFIKLTFDFFGFWINFWKSTSLLLSSLSSFFFSKTILSVDSIFLFIVTLMGKKLEALYIYYITISSFIIFVKH